MDIFHNSMFLVYSAFLRPFLITKILPVCHVYLIAIISPNNMSSHSDHYAHINIVPFDKHIFTTVGNIMYGVLINL